MREKFYKCKCNSAWLKALKTKSKNNICLK